MSAVPRTARMVVHTLTLLCVLAGVLGAVPPAAQPAPELVPAADISQFDPGNIISDSMFFDANALTAQQVQDFIAAKGRTCTPSGAGIPCLKDYRETTFTRTPDGICDGTYTGAPGESAGMIIWKVGQACGISPKVLLVLLQKEQALLTATGAGLTARRYQIAAGMGCPDTAACDTQYYGFYNQVYSAARQYQRYATYPRNYSYRAGATNTVYWSPTASCGTSQVYIANQATAGLYNYTPYRPDAAYFGFQNQGYSAARQFQRSATTPASFGYRAGRTSNLLFNPDSTCGSTPVYIQNQATAGLYVYTPYQPNAAALAAGYGSGDSCSAYGNRNFWLYFTDWFGSTQSLGQDAITASYRSRGGSASALGSPVTGVICGLAVGGCGQVFAGGTLYWTWSTGVRAVTEPVLSAWSPSRESGALGYPVSEYACGMAQGGCGQAFQAGRIYYTWSTGAHALTGDVQSAWIAQGFENGPLGYPTTDLICGMAAGGCGQVFQAGRIYTTAATGTHAVSGPIQDAWIAQGWETAALGYPTGDRCAGWPVAAAGRRSRAGPSTRARPPGPSRSPGASARRGRRPARRTAPSATPCPG